MKLLVTNRLLFFEIDDEDYEKIKPYKWSAKVEKGLTVAIRSTKLKDNTFLYLNRFLMGVTDPSVLVDHEDRNVYNNKKENLRICSKLENNRNVASKRGMSKYKGVSFSKHHNKWRSRIKINGKTFESKSHDTEIAAALHYNKLAKKYFGEFAYLNKVN